MTIGTSQWLRQTLAFTVRAKDDHKYFSGLRETLAYTLRAKDDHMYFFGGHVDPSIHC